MSTTVTVDCAFIRISAMFGEGAIIEKQGANLTEETYKLSEMPSAINQVYNKGVNDGKGSVEVKLQAKTATPKASSQTVSPDSGYDGLSKVTVGAVPTETKSITANGSYSPSSGKFFSKVDVNVPASGITPTGSKTITENGTFDVTNFAQAIVNVASSGGGSDCVTGEKAITSGYTLTLDTGKTDAKHFLMYVDDASFSSSTMFAVLVIPFVAMAFRYSSSAGTIAVGGSKGFTTSITGSISNGVVSLNVGNLNNFTATTYKWIAW